MRKWFKNLGVYFLGILFVIFDQIVKFVVVENRMMLPKVVVRGLLKFTYCENRGVAFGLGDGNVPLFVIINIVLIVALVVYYEKDKVNFNKLGRLFVSMIIAGGFSNLIDRMFRGFVVDFIDVSDLFNFAIFNIADIFITVGVFGLAVYYIFKFQKVNK